MEQLENEELSSQGHAAPLAAAPGRSHGQISAQDQDWRMDDDTPDDEGYAGVKARRTTGVRLDDRNRGL